MCSMRDDALMDGLLQKAVLLEKLFGQCFGSRTRYFLLGNSVGYPNLVINMNAWSTAWNQ